MAAVFFVINILKNIGPGKGMIQVLVRLEVKDFLKLYEFESLAVRQMAIYGGILITAFETARSDDGTGEEVHVLQFPSIDAFNHYKVDDVMAKLSNLRSQAIAKTSVDVSSSLKMYS